MIEFKVNQKNQNMRIRVMKYPDSWMVYQNSLNFLSIYFLEELVADCDIDLLYYAAELSHDEDEKLFD